MFISAGFLSRRFFFELVCFDAFPFYPIPVTLSNSTSTAQLWKKEKKGKGKGGLCSFLNLDFLDSDYSMEVEDEGGRGEGE